MVAIAAGVAAVAAAGATAYGASQSADAARDAAKIQGRAAEQANLTQRELFEQTRQDVAPYRNIGYRALTQLQRGFLRGESPSPRPPSFEQAPRFSGQVNLTEDPGYQFRLQEGQRALERSAAARGGLLSGNQLRDLTRFGQWLASQEYGAAFDRALTRYNADANRSESQYGRDLQSYLLDYNRFQQDRVNRFNRLSALAGLGQTAAQQLGNDRANLGQQISQNTLGAANAAAAGRIGSQNAINQGVAGGINAINAGLQNYAFLSQLNNPAATQPSAYQSPGAGYYDGYGAAGYGPYE